MCKDQTRLTLQRSYRVNLRRDIKGSLSIRCLDTCCFLARQLHVAPKPWIIASSSSSNIWSCPSVLQLFTLSNTCAMTTDLCGYGDKWRKRTGLLMGWIDSRDRHRFAKHCLKNKRWQIVPSRMKSIFRVARPPSVRRTPHCRRFAFRALHQCARTAFLQSATGCSEQSVPAVRDCTYEGGHFTSHLASARATQVVYDRCSLRLTQQKKLAPSTTTHSVFI